MKNLEVVQLMIGWGGGMILIVKEKISLHWIKERPKYIVKPHVAHIFFALY